MLVEDLKRHFFYKINKGSADTPWGKESLRSVGVRHTENLIKQKRFLDPF